jgi:hypothetical protein
MTEYTLTHENINKPIPIETTILICREILDIEIDFVTILR